MSIIVTGAAGFIGSNLVKALNQRGETDIIAVDDLTEGDKFANLADCDIGDYLDKSDFLERYARGRLRHGARAAPPGRLLQHHGERRALHDGQQLPLQLRVAGRQPGPGRAVPLCLVGGGLRRRPELPRGAPLRAAAERLRLLEVPLRPARAPGAAARRVPRWPASATSTSTARARSTRGAWPRWPSTASTSSAATGKVEAVRRVRRLPGRRPPARFRLGGGCGQGQPAFPRPPRAQRASSTSAAAGPSRSTTWRWR